MRVLIFVLIVRHYLNERLLESVHFGFDVMCNVKYKYIYIMSIVKHIITVNSVTFSV